MNWITSWPCPAETSAAMRVVICAWSMWSTLTLTPTLLPQSRANLSNQVSWLGTKWLHSRMVRSPESFFVGSANDSAGAPVGGAAGPPGPASSSLAHPASGPPSAAPRARAPVVRSRSRRVRGVSKKPGPDVRWVIGGSSHQVTAITV
jgi:hypothetical protein